MSIALWLREKWSHHKGGEYYRLGDARIQSATPLSDMDEVVVYRAADDSYWVRKKEEFYDGRFTKLE